MFQREVPDCEEFAPQKGFHPRLGRGGSLGARTTIASPSLLSASKHTELAHAQWDERRREKKSGSDNGDTHTHTHTQKLDCFSSAGPSGIEHERTRE